MSEAHILQWENLLHIATTGRDDTNADTYHYPYEPTPYEVLERLANSGLITKKNTLVDYGCGKGRVSLFLSYQTRCRAVGIEYDERLVKKALENQSKCPSGNRVSFVKRLAQEYEVQPAEDRFFFFNPFSVELSQSVMGRILASYYEQPREMLLCFYYPSDEYISYLMTQPELQFYDEIDCADIGDGEIKREKILLFEISAGL